jgi:hypothetical protein
MDDVGSNEGAITDGELLTRTRRGDRDAFGVLYERRHELVLAFLLKRTRNPEVAMVRTRCLRVDSPSLRPGTLDRSSVTDWSLARR